MPIYLTSAIDRLALHRYYSLCFDDGKRHTKLRAASFTPRPGHGAFRHSPAAVVRGGMEKAVQGQEPGLRVRHYTDGRRARTVFREILSCSHDIYFIRRGSHLPVSLGRYFSAITLVRVRGNAPLHRNTASGLF